MTRRWWRTAGLLGGGVVLLTVLTVLVALRAPVPVVLDERIEQAAHGLVSRHLWVIGTARVVTDLGSPLAVDVLSGLVAVLLAVRRRWRAAVFVLLARYGALATETLLKDTVRRPRPVLEHAFATASNSSFPSGHATGSAAVFVGLAVLLLAQRRTARPSRAGPLTGGALPGGALTDRALTDRALPSGVLTGTAVALVVFAVAVAVSRVLLGVHFPSDVLAGTTLGCCWVAAAALLVHPRQPAHDRGPHPVDHGREVAPGDRTTTSRP